jgi:hypothetical protein
MKISIVNPRPGSTKLTTASQAERYVRRGEAVLNGRELTFLTEAERRHKVNVEKQISISERRASDVYIKGTVWWDGDDIGGMHRPGEVIS